MNEIKEIENLWRQLFEVDEIDAIPIKAELQSYGARAWDAGQSAYAEIFAEKMADGQQNWFHFRTQNDFREFQQLWHTLCAIDSKKSEQELAALISRDRSARRRGREIAIAMGRPAIETICRLFERSSVDAQVNILVTLRLLVLQVIRRDRALSRSLDEDADSANSADREPSQAIKPETRHLASQIKRAIDEVIQPPNDLSVSTEGEDVEKPEALESYLTRLPDAERRHVLKLISTALSNEHVRVRLAAMFCLVALQPCATEETANLILRVLEPVVGPDSLPNESSDAALNDVATLIKNPRALFGSNLSNHVNQSLATAASMIFGLWSLEQGQFDIQVDKSGTLGLNSYIKSIMSRLRAFNWAPFCVEGCSWWGDPEPTNLGWLWATFRAESEEDDAFRAALLNDGCLHEAFGVEFEAQLSNTDVGIDLPYLIDLAEVYFESVGTIDAGDLVFKSMVGIVDAKTPYKENEQSRRWAIEALASALGSPPHAPFVIKRLKQYLYDKSLAPDERFTAFLALCEVDSAHLADPFIGELLRSGADIGSLLNRAGFHPAGSATFWQNLWRYVKDNKPAEPVTLLVEIGKNLQEYGFTKEAVDCLRTADSLVDDVEIKEMLATALRVEDKPDDAAEIRRQADEIEPFDRLEGRRLTFLWSLPFPVAVGYSRYIGAIDCAGKGELAYALVHAVERTIKFHALVLLAELTCADELAHPDFFAEVIESLRIGTFGAWSGAWQRITDRGAQAELTICSQAQYLQRNKLTTSSGKRAIRALVNEVVKERNRAFGHNADPLIHYRGSLAQNAEYKLLVKELAGALAAKNIGELVFVENHKRSRANTHEYQARSLMAPVLEFNTTRLITWADPIKFFPAVYLHNQNEMICLDPFLKYEECQKGCGFQLYMLDLLLKDNQAVYKSTAPFCKHDLKCPVSEVTDRLRLPSENA